MCSALGRLRAYTLTLESKNVRNARLFLWKGVSERDDSKKLREETLSFYLPWLTAESCRICAADNPTTLPSRQM